ncbi:hypothetical protein ACJRO7_019803 [Eucalyptus globulus]|uniref:Fungal lipase-type domain-containing protein n=1 Tax=Eucalyptus globulus TaxID=34317 RepID=A0ABD3KG65_EUCGL
MEFSILSSFQGYKEEILNVPVRLWSLRGNFFYLSGPLHLTCAVIAKCWFARTCTTSQLHLPQLTFNTLLVHGAIFECKPPSSFGNHSVDGPHVVVAFRGTMTKKESVSRDIMLGLLLLQHGLHSTSRFETTMQEVRNMVATAGDSRVWLAGHCLGSAIALLARQNMAKTGLFLESFLFNPPYVPALVEKIKNTKVKLGIRFTTSMITAGLMLAMKAPQLRNQSADSFATLSAWAPQLYVNAADHVCSEYIGYVEHRNKKQEIGPGAIEKLATQHSIGLLFVSAMGKQAEPLHLIPSANLSINLNPSPEYKRAHSIHQWWRHDLNLQSKVYTYS